MSHRLDDVARAFASDSSRRTLLRRLLGSTMAGTLLLTRPSTSTANHKPRHCAKLGQRCQRHKDCCGVCGRAGRCLSCDGVAAWSTRTLAHLTDIDGLGASTLTSLDVMIDAEEPTEEGFATVGMLAETVKHLRETLRTEVTPPAAADPLRTLLEAFAAMADTLATYLEQIYDESFLETSQQTRDELEDLLRGLRVLSVEITALRDDCDH